MSGLPNPGMSFTPFDPLPASDLNDMVENIESLADGTGVDPGAIPVLRNIRHYTANASWSKPADMQNNGFVIVEAVGGGGGGGGSGTNNARGGAGGAGGYCRKKIDAASLAATETVTVGAGGTAGAAGNNAGGNGGDTTFGSHFTAGGGTGGNAANGAFSGATGGTATGGDLNITGQAGMGRRDPSAIGVGQGGEPAFYGRTNIAFNGSLTAANDGSSGTGYGVGGGGGYRTSSNQAGGAGTAGLVIVYEYY